MQSLLIFKIMHLPHIQFEFEAPGWGFTTECVFDISPRYTLTSVRFLFSPVMLSRQLCIPSVSYQHFPFGTWMKP